MAVFGKNLRQNLEHAVHPASRGRRIQSLRAFRRAWISGIADWWIKDFYDWLVWWVWWVWLGLVGLVGLVGLFGLVGLVVLVGRFLTEK